MRYNRKLNTELLFLAVCLSLLFTFQQDAKANALWMTINQNKVHVSLSQNPNGKGVAVEQVKNAVVTASGQTLPLKNTANKSNLSAVLPPKTNLAAAKIIWGVRKNPAPEDGNFLLRYYAKAARTLKSAANPVSLHAQLYAAYKKRKIVARLVENGYPVTGASVKLCTAHGCFIISKTDDHGKVEFDSRRYFYIPKRKQKIYGLQATWTNIEPNHKSTFQGKKYKHIRNYATLTFPIENDFASKHSIIYNRAADIIATSYQSHVFEMRFSANGKKLITAGAVTKDGTAVDKRLRVWSVKSGKEIWRLPAKPNSPDSFASADSLRYEVGHNIIMPDFKSMYTWGTGGYYKIDIHSAHIKGFIETGNIHESIKLSPNGKRLAIGASGVHIVSVKTHKTLKRLWGGGTVYWGPHAKTILCMWGGSNSPVGKPWAVSVATGKKIHYPRWVYRVRGADAFAFSRNGNYIAKAKGHIVEIWKSPTKISAGKLINEFTTTIDVVRVLQFSPDGKTLAVGGSSKTKVPVEFFNLSKVRK